MDEKKVHYQEYGSVHVDPALVEKGVDYFPTKFPSKQAVIEAVVGSKDAESYLKLIEELAGGQKQASQLSDLERKGVGACIARLKENPALREECSLLEKIINKINL